MASVIVHPVSIKVPKFNYSSKSYVEDYERDTEKYLKELKQFCKDNSSYEYAGAVIKFPIADGTADYMVVSANSVIHLPLMDAWEIPEAYMRGLRRGDIESNVLFQRRVEALHKKHGK